MSAAVFSALTNKGPSGTGAANTPDLRFTSSTSQANNALPANWNGKIVEVTNESVTAGDLVAVLFSPTAAATVTIGAAAADGGPATTRGRIILPGTTRRMRLPRNQAQGGVVFFNRIAAANTPVISLALVEYDG